MSVGFVFGSTGTGYVVFMIDAPASSNSLFVLGELHVTCASPCGQKRNPISASGETKSPRPRRAIDWISINPLILFLADACHVNRPAADRRCSSRYAGRSRSGVYTLVPCVRLKKTPGTSFLFPAKRVAAKNHSLSVLTGPPTVTLTS